MEYNLEHIPIKEIMPGYHAKMIHGEKLSIAYWNVEKGGAQVPEHSHEHEQVMQVLEGGEFEFTVDGGVTKIYTPNDLVVIPSFSVHSGKRLPPVNSWMFLLPFGKNTNKIS